MTKHFMNDFPFNKRSYHPMLIVLFHLDLLDNETLRKIPYSTRSYWKHLIQQDQFGYEQVKNFMQVNLDIRAVHESRLVRKFMRFVCRIHDGYKRFTELATMPAHNKIKARKILVESIAHLSQHVKVSFASNAMNVSTQKYYRWKSHTECKISKIKRCFRAVVNQLSFKEVQAIDKAVNDPQNFDKRKISIYYPLLIAGKISCSLSSFYKYCSDTVKKISKPGVQHETLRASRLFQYLHVDITELVCENGKILIAFVKDNFSKAVLGYKIVPDKQSIHIRNLFAEIFYRFNLKEHPERISIVSDGGPENKGELLLWIAQHVVPEVKKLTAGVDVKSNSMSESVHHILKGEFLRYIPPKNPVKTIEDFVYYHNHERYPTEHFGYTCWEVLMGAVPDKNRFKAQMAEGRKRRIEENRKFACLKDTVCKKD